MKNRLAAVALLLLLSGCVHKGDTLLQATGCMADTLHSVSFATNIQPLLRAYCATAGCHSGSPAQSSLNLDSAVAYTQITLPLKGYIDTANPTGSLFYQTLISTTDPMPPTGRLSDCNLKLIRNWIAAGTPNN